MPRKQDEWPNNTIVNKNKQNVTMNVLKHRSLMWLCFTMTFIQQNKTITERANSEVYIHIVCMTWKHLKLLVTYIQRCNNTLIPAPGYQWRQNKDVLSSYVTEFSQTETAMCSCKGICIVGRTQFMKSLCVFGSIT